MERFSIPDCVCKAKVILGTPPPEPRGGAHSREQFETVPGTRYEVLGWPKAGTQRCACHCVTWDLCPHPPPRGRSEQGLGPQRRSGQAPPPTPAPFCRRRGPPSSWDLQHPPTPPPTDLLLLLEKYSLLCKDLHQMLSTKRLLVD